MTETNDVRGVSRRDLMAKTALIGAGLAAGPLLLAACANKPEETSNRSATTCQPEDSEHWKSRNWALGA